jgi:phosphate transport system substrate-binding protein
MRALTDEYLAKNPDVSVKYDSVGSGAGNDRFLGGDGQPVDFAISEAPPSDAELSSVAGGGRLVPVTAGSIVIAYNRTGLPDHIRLSRDAYVDIFLGEIVFWDHEKIETLNPDVDLPHVPITVVTRSDSSGTTFAFTSHLQAASEKWRKSGIGAAKYVEWPRSGGDGRGNEDQAGAIRQTPGALGYVQFGIAERAKLGMAILENAAGNFIEPTAESFLATLNANEMPPDFRLTIPDPVGQDSYPLVTLAWALVPAKLEESGRNPQAIEFLEWCITDGQRFAADLGYAELPEGLRNRFASALREIR